MLAGPALSHVHRPVRRQIHRFLAALLFLTALTARSGEVLYNGIELPPEWPPTVDWETIKARRPLPTPPYLKRPPSVIPIDVGRQLFVDDFLVAQSTLKTRLVMFKGRYPFVNVETPRGELRAEILDDQDRPIPPFSKENCVPIKIDSTLAPLHWNGAADLRPLAGKKVRFQFHLRNGRLYSFWVSPDSSGASHGYIAAGGPGFTSNRDTAGRPNAYDADPAPWQDH